MSTTAATTSKRPKVTTVLLGIAVAIVVCLMITFFTMLFGGVAGTEFAPHNFETRNYHLVRIPVLNLQVWPVQRVSEKSPLVDHLFGSSKILVETKKGDPEFDLVEEQAGSRSIRGDAGFLQKYVADKSGSDWLEWTKRIA
jgi:hypothetical protein